MLRSPMSPFVGDWVAGGEYSLVGDAVSEYCAGAKDHFLPK